VPCDPPAAAAPPPTGNAPSRAWADVCVSLGFTPDFWALSAFAAFVALPALSAALPEPLAAAWPPAAAGWDPSPLPGAFGGVGAGAGVAARSPVAILVNLMPVPRAAVSSWTIRLGMSTLLGIAFPSRTSPA
jgi:hypothetical protein